ncbi:hypothetical protein L1987_06368 [Smallanthus sonchifolius]|uniref:Uncharacterized protein n=1 Tax=Smallanthus sonchifolius TaxID=185202 RepID=A0ACB9JXX4_9ASTR|nr:hypothetical protein L1987_06368 [Smallanthus sonchifolius]
MLWSPSFDGACYSEEGSENGSLADKNLFVDNLVDLEEDDMEIGELQREGQEMPIPAYGTDIVEDRGDVGQDVGDLHVSSGGEKVVDSYVEVNGGAVDLRFTQMEEDKVNGGIGEFGNAESGEDKTKLAKLKKVEDALEMGSSAQLLEESVALKVGLHKMDRIDTRDLIQKLKPKWPMEGDGIFIFFRRLLKKRMRQLSFPG